jgi:hypothetical protein
MLVIVQFELVSSIFFLVFADFVIIITFIRDVAFVTALDRDLGSLTKPGSFELLTPSSMSEHRCDAS